MLVIGGGIAGMAAAGAAKAMGVTVRGFDSRYRKGVGGCTKEINILKQTQYYLPNSVKKWILIFVQLFFQGVVNAGYKDLPSGMATQASSLYSNNILKLLKLFLLRECFCFEQKDDLDYGAIDHVIRGILVMKTVYFGSVVCCAGVLAGLSSQKTSGFGNALGMIGVSEV
ncbi:unnamed protein product [Bubo scandiacus]